MVTFPLLAGPLRMGNTCSSRPCRPDSRVLGPIGGVVSLIGCPPLCSC